MILKYLALDLKGNITCVTCRKKLSFSEQTKVICIALPGRSWIVRATTGATLHRCDTEVVLWCDRCRRAEDRPLRAGRRRRMLLVCRSCRSPLRRREV